MSIFSPIKNGQQKSICQRVMEAARLACTRIILITPASPGTAPEHPLAYLRTDPIFYDKI
jgi:hypothetical protein